MYKIQTWSGNTKLEGTFYEEELQKVNYTKDMEFQIEKVLKERVRRGKKEFLVRWIGYGEEDDTWVSDKDMRDL
jgi:hypothetical protein